MAYSIRQMATALGVSKSQVARDKAAGMPMADASAARAWRLAQHDLSRTVEGRIDRPGQDDDAAAVGGLATAARAGGGNGAPPANPEQPDDDTPPADPEETAKYRRARAEREEINAATARLELQRLQGSLIDLDEAKRLAYTAFRTLRDRVMHVPARLKDQLAATTDAMVVEQLLDAELATALASLDPQRLLVDTDDEDDEAG